MTQAGVGADVRADGTGTAAQRVAPRKEYSFTVVIERDEDGAFIAVCPVLPGCHSAGDTEEEALALVEDAIRLHVEARLELGEPIYEEVGARTVRVAV